MPPVVIAGGIAAAAGIGGAVISSNSTKKAANKAADVSLQVADKNNALAREVYGSNRELMEPFINNGRLASNALTGMLGLSNSMGQAQVVPQAAYGSPQAYGANGGSYGGGTSPITGDQWFDNNGNPIGATPTGPLPSQIQSGGAYYPQAIPAQNAGDPFRTYLANSDYAFQEGEGARKLNHLLASNGSIKSGAAMKEMERFKQNLQAGYRGEYMDRLTGQQNMGMSGASALAGVGQNYVGQVSANNNSAGTAAANAALMRASANANMWSGISNSLGGALGSSYMAFGGGSNPSSRWDSTFANIAKYGGR